MDETKNINDDDIVYALIVEEDDDEVKESERSFPASLSSLAFDSVTSSENDISDVEAKPIDDVVVSNFVEKRKAQFKLPKINKRKFKLYGLFASVGFVAVALLILESPIFSIDKIEIVQSKNTAQFSQDQLSLLNKSLASVKYQQMYRSNFDSSNKKIGNLNFVSSVNFKKVWPSTVKVQITNRVAVATIKTDKGYVLLDKNSIAFAKVPEFQVGLPVFKGFDEITFSKAIKDKNYVSILNNLPDELSGQIAYVDKNESNYLITLTDGIVVHLGDINLLKEKLAIAWSIIQTKNRSELGYIDVSVPSFPVSGQSKVGL
jgi:cell division protein FtsQ